MRGTRGGGLVCLVAKNEANSSSPFAGREELDAHGDEDHDVFAWGCELGRVACISRVHAFERASIWEAVSANGFTVVSKPWFGCTVLPGCVVSTEADANHISASESGFCRCCWAEALQELTPLTWGVAD